MVQSSFHVPETYEIDLEAVRALLREHAKPVDSLEAFELILPALLLLQEHFGWVSKEAARAVAQHLRVPFARVFEVLTFYGDFKLERPGRHRVQLCNGTACHVMGAHAAQVAIERHLGVAAGEMTRDGEVSFDLVPTCLGMCELAPIALIDGKYYPRLEPAAVGQVIDAAVRVPRGEGH
jgi:NADH-quinone oxidoreductase subunit E